jgi:hypothetical protein
MRKSAMRFVRVIGCFLILASASACAKNTVVSPFCILGPLTYDDADTAGTQEWGDGQRAIYERECE